MKTIYIDTLFCVNLFIDYIILLVVRKSLRINSGLLRLIFGAATAAVSSFGVFLPFYTLAFSVIYRVLSAVITVLVAFGITKPLKFFIRVATFAGFSIGFSGGVTLMWLILKPNGVVIYNDTVYFDISPGLLILLTLIVFTVLSIYEKIRSKHRFSAKIHQVTVYSDSTMYTFESMTDTGCNLCEPFSGLPVIIAEKELLENLTVPPEKQRIIPFNTLSGDGTLVGFKPDKTEVDGKSLVNGCYIALSDGKLNSETKSIIGANILEDI